MSSSSLSPVSGQMHNLLQMQHTLDKSKHESEEQEAMVHISSLDPSKTITQEDWAVTVVIDKEWSWHAKMIVEGVDSLGNKFIKMAHFRGPSSFKAKENHPAGGFCYFGHSKMGSAEVKPIDAQKKIRYIQKSKTELRSSKRVSAMIENIKTHPITLDKSGFKSLGFTPFCFFGRHSLLSGRVKSIETFQIKDPLLREISKHDLHALTELYLHAHETVKYLSDPEFNPFFGSSFVGKIGRRVFEHKRAIVVEKRILTNFMNSNKSCLTITGDFLYTLSPFGMWDFIRHGPNDRTSTVSETTKDVLSLIGGIPDTFPLTAATVSNFRNNVKDAKSFLGSVSLIAAGLGTDLFLLRSDGCEKIEAQFLDFSDTYCETENKWFTQKCLEIIEKIQEKLSENLEATEVQEKLDLFQSTLQNKGQREALRILLITILQGMEKVIIPADNCFTWVEQQLRSVDIQFEHGILDNLISATSIYLCPHHDPYHYFWPSACKRDPEHIEIERVSNEGLSHFTKNDLDD